MAARRAVVAAIAVVILAGCGGGHAEKPVAGPPSGSWATPTELHWLTAFGRARESLISAASGESGGPGNCAGELPKSPGPPPTQRLRPAYASLLAACTAAKDGQQGHALALAYRAGDEAVVGAGRHLFSVHGAVDSSTSGGSDASHIDPFYNRAASAVAGKDVTARCWSGRDWHHLTAETDAIAATKRYGRPDVSGFAQVGGSTVNLSPVVCSYLDQIALGGFEAISGPPTELYAGWSLDTLAHESEHARGSRNEARTECYAIQMIPTVARVLGLTPRQGRILTEDVWRQYPHEAPGYSTPACRNGGPLDLHPHSNVWP